MIDRRMLSSVISTNNSSFTHKTLNSKDYIAHWLGFPSHYVEETSNLLSLYNISVDKTKHPYKDFCSQCLKCYM